MKLVENWKDAWRWYSMQAMVASGAILGAWEVMPPDLKGALPDWIGTAAAATTLFLGAFGRIVKQGDR